MKNRLFGRAIIALCVLSVPVTSYAARAEYKWSRPVLADGLAEDEILSVILDSRVYEGTRDDYADLRVVSRKGDQVPYLLEKMTSNDVVKLIREIPSEVNGIERPDANRLVFSLSVTDTNLPVINGMFVDTPLKDFERQLSVFGKSGDGSWTELISNARLYDYSRFIDLRETRIRLPPGRYSAFRVEIDQVTEEKESTLVELERTFQHREEVQRTDRTAIEKRPFRINRISLWTEEQQEFVRVERKADYPVASFEASVDADKKTTVVLVRTHGEPLTELTVTAAGQNFNRHAEVQVPAHDGMQKSWRTISSAVISHIRFRSFEHSQSTLTFPEQRSREFRIVVENEDNPPLQVSAVSARGNLYHIQFLASAGEGYSLAYGSDAALKPGYDAGAILGLLRSGYAPRTMELGEPELNKSFRAGGRSAFLNSSWFFALVVGVFVVTMAAALFRAGKKINLAGDKE